MRLLIERNIQKIEGDSTITDEIPSAQSFITLPIFAALEKQQFNQMMEEKVQKLVQKDEPIIRSYERMRFIYLIAKG